MSLDSYATVRPFRSLAGPLLPFLCPRYRAGLCDLPAVPRRRPSRQRFYALVIRPGFAILTKGIAYTWEFADVRFYALVVGLGLATGLAEITTDL
jgi:hypothetical protein